MRGGRTMNPMLDDLALPQVQEIAVIERRTLAEHKPPGMDGSVLQNMGRRPTRLALWGVASGPDAQDFVGKLDGKFRDGKSYPFAADIEADSNIEKVFLDNIRVQDLAGKPQRYAYGLTLREHIEPILPQERSLLESPIVNDAKMLIKLIDLMGQIKTANQNLDVSKIPGVDKVSKFTQLVTALLKTVENLVPSEADAINTVLGIAKVVGGLSDLGASLKTDISNLIDAIVTDLKSLQAA